MFGKQNLALLLIRLTFGFRLVYGTFDNIISWDRMLEFKAFLESNNFPFPIVCAILSVYLQFFAGVSWILGYKMKLFSLLMIGNFMIATYIHFVAGDPYLSMTPALHLLAISILFYVINPGKISISEYLKSKQWKH